MATSLFELRVSATLIEVPSAAIPCAPGRKRKRPYPSAMAQEIQQLAPGLPFAPAVPWVPGGCGEHPGGPGAASPGRARQRTAPRGRAQRAKRAPMPQGGPLVEEI